jgi:hypothetical protein
MTKNQKQHRITYTPKYLKHVFSLAVALWLLTGVSYAHLIPIDCYYNNYTQEYIVAYYWDEQNLWQYFFAWDCPLYGTQRDINAGDEGVPMSTITDAMIGNPGNSEPTPDPPDSNPDAETGDHGDF